MNSVIGSVLSGFVSANNPPRRQRFGFILPRLDPMGLMVGLNLHRLPWQFRQSTLDLRQIGRIAAMIGRQEYPNLGGGKNRVLT